MCGIENNSKVMDAFPVSCVLLSSLSLKIPAGTGPNFRIERKEIHYGLCDVTPIKKIKIVMTENDLSGALPSARDSRSLETQAKKGPKHTLTVLKIFCRNWNQVAESRAKRSGTRNNEKTITLVLVTFKVVIAQLPIFGTLAVWPIYNRDICGLRQKGGKGAF
ncbi:uncharacterized protein C8R40DRAFT_1269459 [Lentinula edodes]|uniref:uncharacterized protein n=1 Tax=Lentinula edodes TaxID=5353 RepID=UPI001E8CBCCD|nr:uncharacterized protein C8R40DRAFT_1269459 [Lentinula edodes]KAH7867905.1 hypothetical protein C8R40DRAFT_1269459 [Lentinula edodes]